MIDSSGRPLSDVERSVTAKILRAAAGAGALLAQLPAARVVSGPVTFLDLAVPADAPRADLPDGPLPVGAYVEGAEGRYIGEILVWIEDGWLSALEYAWVTDDAPLDWPAPAHVSVEV